MDRRDELRMKLWSDAYFGAIGTPKHADAIDIANAALDAFDVRFPAPQPDETPDCS